MLFQQIFMIVKFDWRKFTPLFFLLLLTPAAVDAVNFDANTTFSFDGGITITVHSGSTATSVTNSGTTLTVVTGSGDSFLLTSPENRQIGIDDGTFPSACTFPEPKIQWSGAKTVVITPSAAICDRSGGGGGGPSPSPAPSPSPSPSLVPPSVIPDDKEVEDPLEFKDVPATDKFIMPLVKLMLEKNTYQFPKNRIYGTKKITKGNFALQIGLGVSDLKLGFEKFPGTKKIRETAVATWPDVAKNWPRGKISRYDFYELLLAVRGISKLENKTVKDLKEACSDVKKPTTNMSQVYFTAKKFGIAVRYKGGKCRLHMPFSRKEAAKFVRFRFPGEP